MGNPIHDEEILALADTGDYEVLQQLATTHANSLRLASRLAGTGKWEALDTMAGATTSPDVQRRVFAYPLLDRVNGRTQNMQQVKSDEIARRAHEPDFIAGAVHHACPFVRMTAADYVDLQLAVDILENRDALAAQRRRVIVRFADEPVVAELVTRFDRRAGISPSVDETVVLAEHTTRREAAVALRDMRYFDVNNESIGPDVVVARRWADDPEMGEWFVKNGRTLGALAEFTTHQPTLNLLRTRLGDLREESPFKSSTVEERYFNKQLQAAAWQLIRRFPNDAQLARAIGKYPSHIVEHMAHTTESSTVLLALAKGPTATASPAAKGAIADNPHCNARVTAALEGAAARGLV